MQDAASRSGWLIKKAKSEKPWAKVHHSHRYFVSRSHALFYYDRKPTEGEEQSSGLSGVIDLREVKRVRPSADATAPPHALDVVLSGRTYVLVPQPATAEERAAWVRTWAQSVSADVIAPELRADLGAECSANGREATGDSPTASDVSWAAPAMPPAQVWPTPAVLMRGFLLKMPLKSEHRSSAKALLGDLAGFKRRYFLLRHGLLQWFRDDPGADGEFLGMLRLTHEASVELERGDARLRVSCNGESILLKDDGGGTLVRWSMALREHVTQLGTEHQLNGGSPAAMAS